MVIYTVLILTAGGSAHMNHKINYRQRQIEVGSISVKVPIIEMGSQRGPSLAITCGVHGNESTSILLVAELVKKLEKIKLQGSIKIILLSNPLATLFNSRVSPLDYQDLNRIAPGNPKGTCSERICHTIMEEILTQEYFIDIHEWPKTETMIQGIVINEQDNSASMEMMKIFNPQINVILNANCYSNSIYAFAHNKKGKKGVALEIPNSNVIKNDDKKRIVASLLNVMAYIGMLNNQYETYPTENITIEKTFPIVSSYNGIFYPLKKVGNELKENSQIGYILEYDLKTKHIIKCSVQDALLINLATNTIINAGDLLCVLGKTQKT